MNEPISLNINNISSVIQEYNSDNENYELEIAYNYDISEKILKKILIFLNKKYSDVTKKVNYILDVSMINNKNHRLSIKSEDSNIINSHCLFENDNMTNSDTFPKNYNLEYKELVIKNYINQLNCRLNLKKEYNETDDEIKTEFIKNYSKFRKTYRFKKRISYEFENYKIDISIVKQAIGQNILLSNISDVLEKIEFEIEYTNSNLSEEILLEMFKIITNINQYNHEGYFNINRNEKNEINKNYSKLLEKVLNKTNDSIGPKPLAFTKRTMKNMLDIYPNNTNDKNILYYKITEKADGERYFMYIDNKSIVYLIGTDKNVLKTGLKLTSENYNNCICDGELLYYKNKENKYIYKYKYFDVYILKNKEVYSNNLDERIKIMEDLNTDLLKATKYINDTVYIECEIKEYYDISDFEDLLNKDTTGTYDIDGIIFMPSLHLTNINNKSYKSILKYKPLEENTVDVLVENEMLYCGYNLKKDYVKSEIMCIKPYIVDIYKKKIKKKNINGSLELMDYRLINNKIVEVVFNVENDCFIFKKIRHDKTEEYTKSITKKITANNFYIVNEILEYTFNNISIEDIKNINIDYIKNELNITDKTGYYKTDKVSRIDDNERKLRKLQNKIKNKLINNCINILENNDDFKFIKALDLACGRGGDLLKLLNTNFIENNSNNDIKKTGGIKLILGIDYSSVNIEYSEKNNNNARGRYLEYKNEYKNKSKNNILPEIYDNNSVYYITGDLALYEDEDIEESYDKIMNDLKYIDLNDTELENNNDFKDRTLYDKMILDSINEKHKDNIDVFDKNQFEFIQCHFAIHYFELEKICRYIDLQLKPGGVFVCTFMEKEYVNELFEKNDSDVVSGKFWSIARSKTDNDNKVGVKFGTLEGDDYKEENFVSQEKLIELFDNYNIKLYNDSMSQIVSGSSSIDSIINFKDHINDTDPEFEFNKLYKGLIFQKPLQNSTKAEQIKKIIK